MVICTDATYRRGNTVPLKPIVDQALKGADSVKVVFVHRRESRSGCYRQLRLPGLGGVVYFGVRDHFQRGAALENEDVGDDDDEDKGR